MLAGYRQPENGGRAMCDAPTATSRHPPAHLRAHDFRYTVHGEVECDARLCQERSLGGNEPEVLKDRGVVHQSLEIRDIYIICIRVEG